LYSPGYPNVYDNNANCTYVIEVGVTSALYVVVNLTYDLEYGPNL
jgi:hypothetical protein